jgi:hypothetical protein
MSFIPAKLVLSSTSDGEFEMTLMGQEILRTKSQKTAVARFKALRRELEIRFPARQPTPEEQAELLRLWIADNLLDHNSFKEPEKKKRPGSTRTFG